MLSRAKGLLIRMGVGEDVVVVNGLRAGAQLVVFLGDRLSNCLYIDI